MVNIYDLLLIRKINVFHHINEKANTTEGKSQTFKTETGYALLFEINSFSKFSQTIRSNLDQKYFILKYRWRSGCQLRTFSKQK